jgi:hypothetical protein
MDYSRIFKFTTKKVYRCVCQECFETLDDALLHLDDDGFCENGIRMYSDDKYQCKCGETNLNRTKMEFNHFYINKGKCIDKKELQDMTFCETCNKHFHNISWYERHIQTNRHKTRLITPYVLDLECKICNIKCLSQNQMKTHLETKKHKERQNSEEQPLDLHCKVCNIKCRGQKEMKAHLETKKHKKNESTIDNTIQT